MAGEDDMLPTEIGLSEIDAVLRFLAVFEQPGYAFGEWRAPEGQMPYYSSSREIMEFVRSLYDHEIVFSFDWMQWQEEAQQYVAEPEKLETADLLTLRKLLTAHVRADRFSEGHLGEMLENGHITAVLRRLQEIRERGVVTGEAERRGAGLVPGWVGSGVRARRAVALHEGTARGRRPVGRRNARRGPRQQMRRPEPEGGRGGSLPAPLTLSTMACFWAWVSMMGSFQGWIGTDVLMGIIAGFGEGVKGAWIDE